MKSFLRIFFSIILSILLVGSLWTFTSIQITKKAFSPSNIKELVSKAKVSELLKDSDGNYTELGNSIKTELSDAGVPDDVIDEFVSSKPIEDFFVDSTTEVVDYLFYDSEYDGISSKDIENLINNNLDDIVEDLREKEVDGIEELTDDRLDEIKNNVHELSIEISDNIPDFKAEVEDSEYEYAFVLVRFLFSNFLTYITLGAVILFTVLLIVLNLRKFSFTCWLTVIYLFVGFPITLVGLIFSITEFSKNTPDVAINILRSLSKPFILYGGIMLAIGLVNAIGGIIAGSVKKKNTNTNININSNNNVVNNAVLADVVPSSVEETPTIEETESKEEPVVDVTSSTEEIYEETIVPKAEETESKIDYHFCANCGSKVSNLETYCANCGSGQKN